MKNIFVVLAFFVASVFNVSFAQEQDTIPFPTQIYEYDKDKVYTDVRGAEYQFGYYGKEIALKDILPTNKAIPMFQKIFKHLDWDKKYAADFVKNFEYGFELNGWYYLYFITPKFGRDLYVLMHKDFIRKHK